MKGQSWQREVNLIPAQIEETVRAKQSWHSRRKNPSDSLPGAERESTADMSVHLTELTETHGATSKQKAARPCIRKCIKAHLKLQHQPSGLHTLMDVYRIFFVRRYRYLSKVVLNLMMHRRWHWRHTCTNARTYTHCQLHENITCPDGTCSVQLFNLPGLQMTGEHSWIWICHFSVLERESDGNKEKERGASEWRDVFEGGWRMETPVTSTLWFVCVQPV